MATNRLPIAALAATIAIGTAHAQFIPFQQPMPFQPAPMPFQQFQPAPYLQSAPLPHYSPPPLPFSAPPSPYVVQIPAWQGTRGFNQP